MPGKMGDALHQWPVAYWWARETGKKFTLWMDEHTCAPLKDLFEAQPCVEKTEYKFGVNSYECGGQPWSFHLPPSDYEGKLVTHLGFRTFPQRQLTLETLAAAGLQLEVDQDQLATVPSIEVDGEVAGYGPNQKICLLHGQAVYSNTKGTPQFWRFLYTIAGELEEMFDRIVWVGSERDREVGSRIYPLWDAYDDHGSFLELARLMKMATLVIGCGSSVVSLAGLLKTNSIRVHDQIGEHPKTLWSNLQPNHLNDTEIELRKSWPEFREKYLEAPVA